VVERYIFSLPSLPQSSPLLFPSLSPIPLEVGRPLPVVLGKRCNPPSAEIVFGAFKPKNLAYGGNNFNDFPQMVTKRPSPGGGTTTLGGGTAISSGGTPDTCGGTPFRSVPAEFNHWYQLTKRLQLLGGRSGTSSPDPQPNRNRPWSPVDLGTNNP